jgi:D-aspartate ligase
LQKDRFHTLAAAFDLPVPRTYFWYGNGDNLADIENPLLVKPIQKEAWGQQGGFDSLFHAKAAVFPNGRALVARPDMVSLKDRIVIQEYIPGSDSQIYSFHGFTDDDGGLMEYFLGRKIRTFPQCTGESSFIEMIKDEELFRTGKNIVDKLGLRGVFKIDFKRNAGNGRFYMLEINPRFNLWLYLACANGINILRTAYEYLVYGIRRRPAGYSTRYKWNNFLLDCHAYRELHSLGELGFVAWIKSLLTPRVQNVFLWKDPAPFLRWASGYVQHRIWRSMES